MIDRASQRVLILVASERDTSVVGAIVGRIGATPVRCFDGSHLWQEIHAGADAVVLGEGAVGREDVILLEEWLRDQPEWSALPVLLISAEGTEREKQQFVRERIPGLQLLDRPIGLTTLESAIATALESRRRQYQVRDLIERVSESEGRFRRMAEENERLYRQQLNIAETLQLALLSIPAEIGPLRIGHLYRSATEAARVGGDFYDVFEVKGGRAAFLVGDVSGHGIAAARTATLVKDVVHAFMHESLRPHQVLRRTNALLVEKDLPGFVTAFVAVLDQATGGLRFASAGHPETLLRRTSGEVQLLGAGSPPLGVFPEATWTTGEAQLEVGDVLLLYTDGVIEARRDGELFGLKRLEELLNRKRVTVERLPRLVLDHVLAFSGGTLSDDLAVLALSLTGKVATVQAAQGARTGATGDLRAGDDLSGVGLQGKPVHDPDAAHPCAISLGTRPAELFGFPLRDRTRRAVIRPHQPVANKTGLCTKHLDPFGIDLPEDPFRLL